jgi:hypothetical protein
VNGRSATRITDTIRGDRFIAGRGWTAAAEHNGRAADQIPHIVTTSRSLPVLRRLVFAWRMYDDIGCIFGGRSNAD